MKTHKEDAIVKQRLKHLSASGLVLDRETIRSMRGRIAEFGQNGYKSTTGTPSQGTVRAWRARNRDVTYYFAEKNSNFENSRRVIRASEILTYRDDGPGTALSRNIQ